MQKFFKVLVGLVNNFEGIDYSLVGSFNLYIQGIKIKPNDLDLVTDDVNIKKIADIYDSKLINNNGYLETEYIIDEVEVHVVSNEKNPLRNHFRDNIILTRFNGLDIPCQSLQSELIFYQKIKREKDKGKIKLIKKIISEDK